MTPSDLRWNLTPWLLLLCQTTYFLMFSWLILLWVIEKEFLGQNLRFDLKWPHLTLEFWDPRCGLSLCPTNKLASKKVQKKVTCDLWIAPKFQFSKSIFSKFWIILELETKILIYFSTPRNPNMTFLDRSQNLQKSPCSFSFNPPIALIFQRWKLT